MRRRIPLWRKVCWLVVLVELAYLYGVWLVDAGARGLEAVTRWGTG